LDFFHPNFWLIFFQPFPSLREFFGLVPGDTPWKLVSDVGGVVGGVMGPRSELEGELAPSSVRLASCISELDEVEEKYAEIRPPVERFKAAVKCD
jgi:hypothetical protein